jgi:hypothetical protein
VSAFNAEGPIPLGNNDMIWFARGRVVVTVPQNASGGRAEAVARIRERYEQVGRPIALAILVNHYHERINDEMRAEIRQAFDEMAPMLACNAIAVLGSGFFASVFISVVSQILRLTRVGGGSYRIHTNLESAASWMHQQLNDSDVPAEEVLETLRWAADPDEVARALAPTDSASGLV